MADNVEITAGTGTTVAADEIAGVKHQRVKVEWGVDGSVVDASASNPLPIVQTGALPSGDNNIGNVDIVTVPTDPFGATADAAVTAGATGSISAKLRSISRDIVSNIVLAAGSAIIGKVGIDQTTPGTTDSVSVATGQGAGAAIGATSGAAVVTDANGTIQQYLRGLVTLWIAGLKAGEAHIGQVGGTSLLVTGTMTRTSDTNVYAAGDGVTTATSSASAMTVTGAARVSGGSGIIFGGVAEKSATSTTNASFRVWIYQATPSAIPNDNAAFTAATHADYQKLVGTATLDFASGIVGSDGVRVPITLERSNMAFKIASGSDLIVIWEARAAYTPASAEVFRLALDVAQD